MPNQTKSVEPYREEDRGYTSPCWIWLRATNGKGYGLVRRKGKNITAPRLYYQERYGQVPEGLHLDHLCRVPLCCNPDHQEPVTHAENARRGDAAKLTWDDVAKIRRLISEGVLQRHIAPQFGVQEPAIWKISKGLRWAGSGGKRVADNVRAGFATGFDGPTRAGDVKHDRVPGKGRGRTLSESFNVYPADRKLLLAIMLKYGCSKAEAFRTIVRAHALQLGISAETLAEE